MPERPNLAKADAFLGISRFYCGLAHTVVHSNDCAFFLCRYELDCDDLNSAGFLERPESAYSALRIGTQLICNL